MFCGVPVDQQFIERVEQVRSSRTLLLFPLFFFSIIFIIILQY